MYSLIQFFTLVLVVTERVYSEQCNDCVNYDLCPTALNILLYNRTATNIELLRRASCGFDNSVRRAVVPRVCCSVFSTISNKAEVPETSEDERIANHENLKLLPADCGNIQGNRIVGGEIAELYEFPWMALIEHETRYGTDFQCGGSIINKRYILTAAHCVKNMKIVNVRVGEYNLDTDIDCRNNVCEKHIQNIQVEEHVIHNEYDTLRSGINDIALLRLQEDIDFNHKNVHRICLPTTSELRHQVVSHKIATVSGWGLTENRTFAAILRKVDIPILTSRDCSNIYNRYSKPGDLDATTNQLCAGAPKKDSCQRDSGGPLLLEQEIGNVYRYVQYGIVSHGPGSCGSKEPGAYVDVTKYMGWILDNISP